jgi:uroporphyrinogen decarboxylase
MTSVFHRALADKPTPVPPMWMMRQAGRYHSHYQRLRASHSFEALCRTPELAAQVALGPIADFDFDAAILFSDLLFPLDAFGLRVSYDQGRPEVEGPLTFERIESFVPMEVALSRLSFQRDAVCLTRARLPPSKGLIGFIGGPWTLFAYARLRAFGAPSRQARDLEEIPLYNAFAAQVVPLLIECARQQLQAGADIIMMFDTAAGALPPGMYGRDVARDVRAIAAALPGKMGYYARDFSDAHEKAAGLDTLPLAGVGLDMHRDLAARLRAVRNRNESLPTVAQSAKVGFIHGNMDPPDLLLTGASLEQALERFVAPLRVLDTETRRGWMCGLGHGVLPGTPEESVRRFVTFIRGTFS